MAVADGTDMASPFVIMYLWVQNQVIYHAHYFPCIFILCVSRATIPEREEPATSGIGSQTPVTYQESGYIHHEKYTTTLIPLHLQVFYDELYEACWKGDNASIQELCLPKQVAEGKEPIQIVVQTRLCDRFASSGALLANAVPESSVVWDFFS
jgi:hypothetical protein